jgi:hypothetical protein
VLSEVLSELLQQENSWRKGLFEGQPSGLGRHRPAEKNGKGGIKLPGAASTIDERAGGSKGWL